MWVSCVLARVMASCCPVGEHWTQPPGVVFIRGCGDHRRGELKTRIGQISTRAAAAVWTGEGLT